MNSINIGTDTIKLDNLDTEKIDLTMVNSLDFSDDYNEQINLPLQNQQTNVSGLSNEVIKKAEIFFNNFDIKESDDCLELNCKKHLFLYINGNFLEVSKDDSIKVAGRKLRLQPLESWDFIKENISKLSNKFFSKFKNTESDMNKIEHKDDKECICHQ